MEHTSQSLLERLQSETPDDSSWQRLVDVYQPLISHWLRKTMTLEQDADDLTQEILLVVMREVRDFSHPGHRGAFRGWLKAITINRLRSFARSRSRHPNSAGGTAFLNVVAELEDPDNRLSQLWDEDHDRFVLRRLLTLMESEFETKTLNAFRRTALLGDAAKCVAVDLQMSVGAVYVAKSAVLRRLREEAMGLID